MSDLFRYYTDDVHANFDPLFAAWPPTTQVALGDFGYLRHNVFERKSNLKYRGIAFSTEPPDPGISTYDYSSKGAVRVSASGAAATSAPQGNAQAKIGIEFKREGSVYLHAIGCAEIRVKDEIELGNRLVALFLAGQWNDDWVVVTRVVTAKSATILMASDKDASITLEASGQSQPPDLLNANVKLSASSERNIGLKVITESELTPLFGLSQVRDRILNNPDFRTRRFIEGSLGTPDSFRLLQELQQQGKPASERFAFLPTK